MAKMEEQSDTKRKSETEDSDERFQEDPEEIYRIYSVLSYFVVLVIIGIPIWWQTTKVYRAPLPLEEMFALDVPAKTIRPDSIPLSLEYDILVTIMNPSTSLKVVVDANELAANLEPFINSLSPIANFTVKSQWLYMTDLGLIPRQGKDHNFMVTEDALAHVISSLEKKTWAHMSPRPSLNLVLYFTHCEKPFHLYTREKKHVESNAFLNLRWGGIMINNADNHSCTQGVYRPPLKPIVDTFLTQLQELMYLKSTSKSDIRRLEEMRAWEMVLSARRTLKSLAQLLIEINSIVISDEVADKIKIALYQSNEAANYLDKHDIREGLKAAKIAYENAEAAFSDPSLLALLYFPDDQKYAVYIPLFLPIMIPVFMSLVTIQKWCTRKNTKAKKD